MTPDPKDVDALIREKYRGDRTAAGIAEDTERLTSGKPLAYVIGHIPFLGLSVHLDSRPLIPRSETEWWTEQLIEHLTTRGDVRVLDLCAGSGAIGLAMLKHCPNARVSFGELVPEHAETIRQNIEANGLDASRADVRAGDLFGPFANETFDIIATNPPYIPAERMLPHSVAHFEPAEALYGNTDGLLVIRRILAEARTHMNAGGELWMECDIDNIHEAQTLAPNGSEIRNDQYGRPRLLVSYY